MSYCLPEILSLILGASPAKIVLSHAGTGSSDGFQKMVLERRGSAWLAARFRDRQVFHLHLEERDLRAYLEDSFRSGFRQMNAWSGTEEHIVLLSKKAVPRYQKRSLQLGGQNLRGLQPQATRTKETGSGQNPDGAGEGQNARLSAPAHNRKKNYLLEEGIRVPALVDMGVLTEEGAVVRSMYDKFRQINRFLEIIDDGLKGFQAKQLRIIDFGCGKSYLSFVLYHFLTVERGLDVQMIGLDLKEDVIENCRKTAEKYGYTGLRFELGSIGAYEAPFAVDMIVSLHACDTATDEALYHALRWGAPMIFAVPCCQHELNAQIKTEELSLLTRYGIVKERFSALLTDALRAGLLELCGYKTQLLEFVDFEHTPKNLLIRAVKRNATTASHREKRRAEVEATLRYFSVVPTLYSLLAGDRKFADFVKGGNIAASGKDKKRTPSAASRGETSPQGRE